MASSDPTFDTFPDLASLFDVPTTESWRAAAEASLKGRPLDRLTVRTHEGLAVQPLYSRAESVNDPGYPGQSPFVRGRTAAGGDSPGWTVCQTAAHPDPEIAARWAAEDAGRGADAVWLIFDAAVRTAGAEPTEAAGDGIFATTAADLEPFFDRIDPKSTAIHVSAGSNAPAVAAALLTAARRHDVNPHDLKGCFGFDPLGSLAADGVLTAGLIGSGSLMTEMVGWATVRAPGMRVAAVDTSVYHLAGAGAVQELAIAVATAVEYLRAMTRRGVDATTACRQIVFRFPIARDLFMEAAKLRACRRIWARIAETCGVDEDHRGAVIHAVSAPRGLARRDPWVNLLRCTVGSFAATVGGADLITVLPFDHAIGLPDGLARRMAVNSQTILREESHLGRVIDPGGGSWTLEWLTDELATAAWEQFQTIERGGGMVQALLDGTIASQLARAQDDRDSSIATRRDPITGVSSYPNLDEKPVDRDQPDAPRPSEAATATEELARAFKAANEPTADGSVIEAAIAAAAADATIGKLSEALRGTREQVTMPPLPARREAEAYERLRTASDSWLKNQGRRPQIFLANMGPIPEHKPRASFAKNFFEAGGIETLGSNGFDTVDDAVAAFADSDTAMAVICSSDTRYPEVVPELAAALDDAGARTILLAGKPGDHETAWRAAGVTGFIHIGCDQVRLLVDLLQEEGVLHV